MNTPGGDASAPSCRLCGERLHRTFVDLGMSPLCQRHVRPHELAMMEPFYPLHVYFCERCYLVQLPEHASPSDIFASDYAYFSSYSDSWLAHARRFADWATERFSLDANSNVVEIASNDGYLLRNFVEKKIPCLGVEPAANCAAAAVERGVPTIVRFFGVETARHVAAEYGRANLIVGNNVLAHVPDLNDFVAGMKALLAPRGVISMEFPHLLKLIDENQFDTIYHEHYSYFSFLAAENAFARHGLTIFDVQEHPTHGGSLRIIARHADDDSKPITPAARELHARELARGLDRHETYVAFDEQVRETKRKLLEFLIEQKRAGRSIVGYGAPGKGNTLLNYCGIRTDFLDYTVDRSPHKQGNYLPGTRIPILHPDRISQTRPDFVLILPWNLKDEIMRQMRHIGAWGGRFVTPIPETRVYDPAEAVSIDDAPVSGGARRAG